MTTKKVLFVLLYIVSNCLHSQTYPTFGKEISVTTTGLTFDAMEASISADGNFIFFNSLNNGTTTSLYYATKVNDSVFTYVGPLTGANQTVTPRLDAVASSDSANNFFWTSTRDFPTQFDNFFHGIFNGTDVINIGRVHGSLYIYKAGWIMMDAAINYSGNLLYYTNAYFGPTYAGCGIPCEAKLGVAQKINDSIFNKLSNSDALMANINDTNNYIVYAPFITKDGLELYFTRILKSSPTQTEMCVSVRSLPTDVFSVPVVIPTSGITPEASTLTTDQSKMYYHKKVGSVYKLFLRYRTSISTKTNESFDSSNLSLFPNPVKDVITIDIPDSENFSVEIYSTIGERILGVSNSKTIDVSGFQSGIYLLRVIQDGKNRTSKIMKQ